MSKVFIPLMPVSVCILSLSCLCWKMLLAYAPQKSSANFLLKNAHTHIVSLHAWMVSSYLLPLGALLLIETSLMVSEVVLLDFVFDKHRLPVSPEWSKNASYLKFKHLGVFLSVVCHN
jgi:hypothetical protein